MAANDRFEVPPELRTFAERSVEQARQAFDGFISAAHNAMSAFEGQAETARKGARDVTEKAMAFRRTQHGERIRVCARLDARETFKRCYGCGPITSGTRWKR